MLRTSDNVCCLFAFVIVFFIAADSPAQSLSYRVDPASYESADQVFFHLVYRPNTSSFSQIEEITQLEYVFGRPAQASEVRAFGLTERGVANSRYLPIDGPDVLLASESGNSSSFLRIINSNLSRFGLSTSQERLQAIAVARGLVQMPEIVDSSSVQSTLGSIIVSWLKIAMSLGVAFYGLWTGYRVLKAFVASRSIDSSEDWRDYAGDEAELYSSQQEWEDSIMERNRLETQWAENRAAARSRGEKLLVPKVYLGEDPEGNALYID